MIEIKVMTIEETPNSRIIIFKNPVCGHEQRCPYAVPWRCQDPACSEKNPSYERLYGGYNQDVRVKYFVRKEI
jgi:hypothetical protein